MTSNGCTSFNPFHTHGVPKNVLFISRDLRTAREAGVRLECSYYNTKNEPVKIPRFDPSILARRAEESKGLSGYAEEFWRLIEGPETDEEDEQSPFDLMIRKQRARETGFDRPTFCYSPGFTPNPCSHTIRRYSGSPDQKRELPWQKGASSAQEVPDDPFSSTPSPAQKVPDDPFFSTSPKPLTTFRLGELRAKLLVTFFSKPPKPLTGFPLGKLPAELVREIATHMDDATILALATAEPQLRPLMNLIRPKTGSRVGRLRHHYKNVLAFLRLLQRDYPGTSVCYQCQTLHPLRPRNYTPLTTNAVLSTKLFPPVPFAASLFPSTTTNTSPPIPPPPPPSLDFRTQVPLEPACSWFATILRLIEGPIPPPSTWLHRHDADSNLELHQAASILLDRPRLGPGFGITPPAVPQLKYIGAPDSIRRARDQEIVRRMLPPPPSPSCESCSSGESCSRWPDNNNENGVDNNGFGFDINMYIDYYGPWDAPGDATSFAYMGQKEIKEMSPRRKQRVEEKEKGKKEEGKEKAGKEKEGKEKKEKKPRRKQNVVEDRDEEKKKEKEKLRRKQSVMERRKQSVEEEKGEKDEEGKPAEPEAQVSETFLYWARGRSEKVHWGAALFPWQAHLCQHSEPVPWWLKSHGEMLAFMKKRHVGKRWRLAKWECETCSVTWRVWGSIADGEELGLGDEGEVGIRYEVLATEDLGRAEELDSKVVEWGVEVGWPSYR
ncbi:MAG: hypothetical protein M1821_000686 [Bathelium mastoideum]|nr:MAG: hypothetical protein M1821_000686 [Bathelium mastoideum]